MDFIVRNIIKVCELIFFVAQISDISDYSSAFVEALRVVKEIRTVLIIIIEIQHAKRFGIHSQWQCTKAFAHVVDAEPSE